MKLILCTTCLLLIALVSLSQSVGIGTTTPNTSALLDVQSTSKGLLPPRMSSAQRNAIASPASGLIVYDTDKARLYMYAGNQWRILALTDNESAPMQTVDGTGSSDLENGMGMSVSVSGNYAIAGAPYEYVGGVQYKGAAYIFTKVDGIWVQQQRLSPAELVFDDFFGTSVDISGDYAVVSAPARGTGGAVFIFKRNGTVWQHETTLTTAAPDVQFGSSVSIDGDRLVVGSPAYDAPNTNSGAVHVYHRNGTAWNNVSNFPNPTPQTDARFGTAVSIRGNVFIAGAPYQSYASVIQGGVAHVYTFSGSSWILEDELRPQFPNHNASFGASVDITSAYAVVGAPSGSGLQGNAYLFRRVLVTLTTYQWDYLSTVENGFSMGSGAQFGYSVAFNDNTGTYIAVSANSLKRDFLPDAGACFLYRKRDGELDWPLDRTILDTPGEPRAFLGNSVSLYGTTLIAGKPKAVSGLTYGVGKVLFADFGD